MGLLSLLFSVPAAAGAKIGQAVDAFTLSDYRGREYNLAEFKNGPVVVAFLGTECPLAKLYGPRLQQLADSYADQGVSVIGISSNVQDSVTELGSYARRHDVKFPILKDVGNHVADQFGAQRTPEVFLLDTQRHIVYRGRIDDKYVVGVARKEASREDLRAAIDEVLAGKPVSIPETQPLGCLIGRIRAPNESSDVTYSNQIARLFNQRCVDCHREGEIGPFSLTTYEEAAGWGEMIAEVVRDQRMPPWHADPHYGQFANARRLTDEERGLIETWVKNGCPQGNPSDLPEPPSFTEGWQLPRAPDAVYAMADKPFEVPADGGKDGVRYQRFEVDPKLTEDKWFNASEVQPSARSVVHHIIVYAKPPNSKKRGDRMFLTAYVPGLRLSGLPEGSAKRIPAGYTFLFEIHYTPDGTPHEDMSRAAFCWVDPATIKNEVVTTEVVKPDFVIPPHADNESFSVRSGPIPDNVTMLSLSPHMHVRGKSFKFEALYPDKTREVLLDVPHYDFNWQTRYVLAEPRKFPTGTRIICTAAFDNSEANLANPDPTETVRWGEQSWEEMLIGYFDCLLPRDDTRKAGSKPFRTMLTADDILEKLDADKNGEISREEAKPNAALTAGFDKVDQNEDGALQLPELTGLVTFLNSQGGN
ncbi:MAG: redoxin domain-containing protein [Planctomycetaceae bacterium]